MNFRAENISPVYNWIHDGTICMSVDALADIAAMLDMMIKIKWKRCVLQISNKIQSCCCRCLCCCSCCCYYCCNKESHQLKWKVQEYKRIIIICKSNLDDFTSSVSVHLPSCSKEKEWRFFFVTTWKIQILVWWVKEKEKVFFAFLIKSHWVTEWVLLYDIKLSN